MAFFQKPSLKNQLIISAALFDSFFRPDGREIIFCHSGDNVSRKCISYDKLDHPVLSGKGCASGDISDRVLEVVEVFSVAGRIIISSPI